MTIRARFDESQAKSRARHDAARERRTARRQATLLATVFFGAIIVPQAIAGGEIDFDNLPECPAGAETMPNGDTCVQTPPEYDDGATVDGTSETDTVLPGETAPTAADRAAAQRGAGTITANETPADIAPDLSAMGRALAAERSRNAALRSQIRIERKRHSAAISRLRGVIMGKTSVRTALRLAAATHGVSESELRRVAWCESRNNPRAVGPASSDGRPVGLLQFKPAKWSETPYRFLPRTDPYASAMAAAYVVRREGWRAWECKP